MPKFIKRFFYLIFFVCLVAFTQQAALAAQATLSWQTNNPGPEGYRVFMRTQGQAYNYASPVWTGSTVTCTIGSLLDNTTYYFVARAFNGADLSGDSNEVSFINEAAPVAHIITASAGANGSISPSGAVSVLQGADQGFTISPAAHYHVADVRVDNNSVGAVESYTFSSVAADHTISATFAADVYTITASAGAGGGISPSGAVSVSYGAQKTFAISANAGYRIADVLVDGQSVGAVQGYTFTSVSANHTIAASFQAITHIINAQAGPGGAVSPAGQISVSHGGNQSFNITAQNGYEIDDLIVDAVSMGKLTSYTFINVSGDHSIEARFVLGNQPPVADAGPNQIVDENTQVLLSGLNSMDPDDGIAAYAWRQLSGPAVALSSTSEPEVTFAAPEVGPDGQSLVFELTVADQAGKSAADTCIVNVTWVNEPPVAQAGADQTANEGQVVYLDGVNSMDPDDNIVSYQWTQINGSQVELVNATAASPFFTAPDVGPQGASLAFQLTVTDSGGLRDSDTCIVNIAWINKPPLAAAGPDQQVYEGAEVVLDGSNSSDADDGIAAYQWTQVSGAPVVLSDAAAIAPVFTAPAAGIDGAALTFQLTVIDHGGLQHQDSCIINVISENLPPVAQSGPDQSVTEGSQVQLDGSASDDPDDGIASFSWTQIAGPVVALSDPKAVQPFFRAPDVGTQGASLTFKLTVTDLSGLKAEDTCIVNITWQNQPPLANAGDDQQSESGQIVTLSGIASHDSDDGIASYQWKQVSGAPVALANSGAMETTFTAPANPDTTTISLGFELTVTDKGGLQSTDSCVVVVNPAGADPDTVDPVIQITQPSMDFTITRRSRISLSGTAWDDRAIDRVVWTTSAGYSGEASGSTSWRISDIRLRRWLNTITVTVFDKAGNQSSDTIYVFAGRW